LSNTM